jgi:hypothetical protein
MKIKPGKRAYHAIFGWCKIETPPNSANKCLVNLEADEIEYYVMGQGYVHYKRGEDNTGDRHILLTPIEDLFESEKDVTDIYHLKKMALNPTLTFWDK